MPEFQARDPEHQQWKARVLSGEIDLEDLDTSSYDRYLGQPEEHLAASRSAAEIKRALEDRDRERQEDTA